MERMWFYAQGNERKGPVPESELKAMIQRGEVTANDLAWTEGMGNWASIFTMPDLTTGTAAASSTPAPAPQAAAPAAYAAPAAASVSAGGEPIPEGLLGWMGFVGIVTIVSGAFNVLSCFGVIFGAFQVISGVALMGAKTALSNIDTVPASLGPFFQKLKTFTQMTGIFYITVIVTMVLILALYAAIFAAAFSQIMSQMPH